MYVEHYVPRALLTIFPPSQPSSVSLWSLPLFSKLCNLQKAKLRIQCSSGLVKMSLIVMQKSTQMLQFFGILRFLHKKVNILLGLDILEAGSGEGGGLYLP